MRWCTDRLNFGLASDGLSPLLFFWMFEMLPMNFCTTIGSFFVFFFFLFFSIDSKWKNRYSVRDILCPFLASRKINSFRLALFLYNPDPWRPRKLRLVSHELASTRILRNIIYESQRNRRRKKEIEKEWWETEEKERPVLLREPGKRKGSAAAGTVRWGGGGRLFLFTSSQVSVRRNSFSDISRFFRFFPPFFFYWNSHCVRVAVLLLLLGQHLTPKGLFFRLSVTRSCVTNSPHKSRKYITCRLRPGHPLLGDSHEYSCSLRRFPWFIFISFPRPLIRPLPPPPPCTEAPAHTVAHTRSQLPNAAAVGNTCERWKKKRKNL